MQAVLHLNIDGGGGLSHYDLYNYIESLVVHDASSASYKYFQWGEGGGGGGRQNWHRSTRCMHTL